MLISELKEENIENRNIPLLDLFMDNAAEGLGKEVEAMETTKEQCRPLNKISNEKVTISSIYAILLVIWMYAWVCDCNSQIGTPPNVTT